MKRELQDPCAKVGRNYLGTTLWFAQTALVLSSKICSCLSVSLESTNFFVLPKEK